MDFGRSESRAVNCCLAEMKLLTEIDPKAPRTNEISTEIKSCDWLIMKYWEYFAQIHATYYRGATWDIWQCGCVLYHTLSQCDTGPRLSRSRLLIAGSIRLFKISKIIQYSTEQTLRGCSSKKTWWGRLLVIA